MLSTPTTIIIQLPFNHQSNNGVSISCEYDGGSNSLQKKDKEEVKIDEDVIYLEEVKIDEDVIYLKKEVKDVKPNDNCIEEFHAMFDIDERLFNNDPNMHNNIFSPISITDSIDTQAKQEYVPEYYDDDYNAAIKECLQDIFEFAEYLQQDMIMN